MSCLPFKGMSNDHAAGSCCHQLGRRLQSLPTFVGGWEVSSSSGHQHFLGRESELLAFITQEMRRALSSALYSGFGHHPGGELEHRVILLGRGWEINSLLRHWAGNRMQVTCFCGQEDGVEVKFPDHSVENSIFSNCVGWI